MRERERDREEGDVDLCLFYMSRAADHRVPVFFPFSFAVSKKKRRTSGALLVFSLILFILFLLFVPCPSSLCLSGWSHLRQLSAEMQ